MSDIEVDNFLEHYGVKGQRWGIRNSFKKGKQGDWHKRSFGQKVGLVAGSYGGATLVAVPTRKIQQILAKNGSDAVNVLSGPIGFAATVTGAVLGGRFTRNVLQKKGKRQMSRIKFEDD